MPHAWWRKRAPRARTACFRTKTNALNALREANWRLIEEWGGMDQRESPVEFEAVNHKYGTRARTLAEAMWVALRSTRRPYCLDDIDLEALNDTDPGRRMGGFQLPDWYHEARAAEEQERYYREQYGIGRTRMTKRMTVAQCKRRWMGRWKTLIAQHERKYGPLSLQFKTDLRYMMQNEAAKRCPKG